jgi:hypothetical protein
LISWVVGSLEALELSTAVLLTVLVAGSGRLPPAFWLRIGSRPGLSW